MTGSATPPFAGPWIRPASNPLAGLGNQIAAATGLPVFAGQYGWLLTLLLLLLTAAGMITLGLALGRRRTSSSR